MTRYMPQEPGAWPHVPAGDYEGMFTEYTLEKDKPDFNGNLRDQFRFTADFGEVEDSAGGAIHLTLPIWCNVPKDGATVSSKSNLWALAVACGIDPAVDGIDPDDMLARLFVGEIQDKEKAAVVPGQPPTIYSKLADIRTKREVKARVNGGATPPSQPAPRVAPVDAAIPGYATEDIPF